MSSVLCCVARKASTLVGAYADAGEFSLANKHFLKAADLAAIEGDYYKAIEHYERISRTSINNGLMKWSVKEYLLKAGICHLATMVRLATQISISLSTNPITNTQQDMVSANRALESYREIDNTFASTREHQLLVDLVQTIEERDQEGFADKLFQYDQLSKLDKWKTTLLLKIKNGIEGPEEDDFA
jgi:alpha-soluble NSF attachment protein